jgi:phospholipase/carboxylesterase
MTTALEDVRSSTLTNESTLPVAILLHGFGSNQHDMSGLAQNLGLATPWASLRAPLTLGNGGAAWFEIVTPGDPDAGPVVEATDAIWAWVEANIAPEAPIIAIGFSQGGLMASQLLRSRPERVAATIVLGGFVLGAEQPGDEWLADNRPAVFWGRGAEDRVIGQPAIARTSGYLPAHSALTEKIYPGLAHGINVDELIDVRAYLSEHVGADVVATR